MQSERIQNVRFLCPLPEIRTCHTPPHISVFTNQESHLSLSVQSVFCCFVIIGMKWLNYWPHAWAQSLTQFSPEFGLTQSPSPLMIFGLSGDPSPDLSHFISRTQVLSKGVMDDTPVNLVNSKDLVSRSGTRYKSQSNILLCNNTDNVLLISYFHFFKVEFEGYLWNILRTESSLSQSLVFILLINDSSCFSASSFYFQNYLVFITLSFTVITLCFTDLHNIYI